MPRDTPPAHTALPAGTFEHAKIVMTRWGLGLAFIEIRDEDDVEGLRLQLWAPVGSGGSAGQVKAFISLDADASDAAHDKMSEANRQVLCEMTPERFEAAISAGGVGEMLDEVFAIAAATGGQA